MKIFLVVWTAPREQVLVKTLKALGHEVELENRDGVHAYHRISEAQPDLVIVDGDSHASRSRAVANALEKTKRTNHIPICVVDLPRNQILKWQSRQKFLVYRSLEELIADGRGKSTCHMFPELMQQKETKIRFKR